MESSTTKQFPRTSEVWIAPLFCDALYAEQAAQDAGKAFYTRHSGLSASVYEVGTRDTRCTVADLLPDRPEGSGAP